MAILAIDTSGPLAFVSLRDSKGLVHSACSSANNSHNEELPGLVSKVLMLGGSSMNDLKRIILGIGPGSFTGLRIGLSYAQGLSFSLQIPITAISSLAAYAGTVAQPHSKILVVSDARREEVFAARFISDENGDISLQGEEGIVPEAGLDTVGWIVTGFASTVPGVVEPRNVAEALLELSDRGFGKSAMVPSELTDLTPNYLREVAAKTIQERLKKTS